MDASHGYTDEDLRCLEALYDAPDPEKGAYVILESAGLTFEAAQHWVIKARNCGWISEIDAALVPADCPSGQGRAIVEEVRARRQSPSYRRRETEKRVLTWADRTGGGNIKLFLESDHARIDGDPLTLEQAAEAVSALHHDGLVKGNVTTAWGTDVVHATATITPVGRRVLDQHDGDVSAWRAMNTGSTSSVTIHHNTGAIAFGGDHATVNATTGIDANSLGALIEALTAGRDRLDLTDEALRDYDARLAELHAPEPSRVREAVRWFGGLGSQVTANALGSALATMALSLLG